MIPRLHEHTRDGRHSLVVSNPDGGSITLTSLAETVYFLDLLRLVVEMPPAAALDAGTQLGVRFHGHAGFELVAGSGGALMIRTTGPGDSLTLSSDHRGRVAALILGETVRQRLTKRLSWLEPLYEEEKPAGVGTFLSGLLGGFILVDGGYPWCGAAPGSRIRILPLPLPELVARTLTEEAHTRDSLAAALRLDESSVRSVLHMESRYNQHLLAKRYLVERSRLKNSVISYSAVRIHPKLPEADPGLVRVLLSPEPAGLPIDSDRVRQYRHTLFAEESFNLLRHRSLDIGSREVQALKFWSRYKPSILQPSRIASLSLRLFDLRRSYEEVGDDATRRQVESLITEVLAADQKGGGLRG